ncbi:putative G3BP-like protein-like [Capsicum annuum]|nr:putative G3BP-like protein-like [Capsicum annuum]
MLPKEPSFCIYNKVDGVDELKENQDLLRSVTIGDLIPDIGRSSSSDFSFGKKGMGLIEEDDDNEEVEKENEKKRVFCDVNELGFEESEVVVISGFGVDGNGVNGVEALDFDGNGDVEEYYKRIVKDDPFNPLFLRNYAQLLQFWEKGNGEEDDNEEGEKENEKKGFFVRVVELSFEALDFDGNGDIEEYYKRVVKEDPFNPLFLRNYAQLLQSKGDLSGAEHHYFQATLADPKDGDTLSKYAILVWELHQDKDKASDYFERAVHAAPENSNVLAAYASFLWDTNDDDSEDDTNMQSDKNKIEESTVSRDLDYEENNTPVSSPLHLAAGLGIGDNIVGGSSPVGYTADISDMDVNAEEYYMRMINENPHNPVLLRNYAKFLSQSKGDLQGAEEYYSRAILADPTDGETISHYAILTWQLHSDKYKASSYFKRAVQASPEDSDVLAAYARFLWQTEEDEHEEDEILDDHNGAPLLQGLVVANV